jgi:hypothetical protein
MLTSDDDEVLADLDREKIRNALFASLPTAQCKCLETLNNFALGGSVEYGLPTLAVTRRTKQTQEVKTSIEEINRKLCKIMSRPSEYVTIDPKELASGRKLR